ncbi:MAG: acylneuraminate cytidylyltransferase family protein [Alphaproteobacteria bacterium]|nr:acylneuraminate cytidylyltransferase family protein [Alphaproteobacteria bacterium]MBU2082829.1 acylneuraminate cytidylyltransferase family protein [Alphaproteobacteria bacterium]MBU2142987.1 acylneuraminate cytidylyltransferase family protein [Alphaproteobacteria bacterium]MBU2196581.1 acylneuraminate cytidylyltransferase family protein [Alphaproteobacteria bacterium]
MKAHSARVKSKNFRLIAGKPLFQWIVDALLAVPAIDKVVINTDARQILADEGLFDSERIMIRDRKPELCGDFVSMNLVLADDIANVPSDHYLMTHTTNPLLQPDTIRNMIGIYLNAIKTNAADSLFTVNEMHTRFYTVDGAPINHDPDNLIRTQDLPAYMEENSVCYLFSPESFEATSARIGKTPLLFPTPKLQSVDIDEIADWFIAESLLLRVAAGEALPEEA